jgi:hypothetical protein
VKNILKRMNDKFLLPVESIQERDIDLILLEKFSTNQAFCRWFVKELKLPKISESIGAWKSISGFGLGETDIFYSYKSKGKIVYVLIENKLDASFQENQKNRYLERGKQYIKSGVCDDIYCILIAPSIYCENQNDFEIYVSYESIMDWLLIKGSKNHIFKAELLKIAIEKLRRGYQPINSEIIQKFWQLYWKNKEEKFPNLFMKKPKIVPFNSDWPTLYDNNSKAFVFYHKLSQGNIDLNFKSKSKELENNINKILIENYELVKHKKSFSVRINVEKIDRTKDFQSQIDKIDNALEKLEELRIWVTSNKNYLK